jgi:hypothetical protein
MGLLWKDFKRHHYHSRRNQTRKKENIMPPSTKEAYTGSLFNPTLPATTTSLGLEPGLLTPITSQRLTKPPANKNTLGRTKPIKAKNTKAKKTKTKTKTKTAGRKGKTLKSKKRKASAGKTAMKKAPGLKSKKAKKGKKKR